MQLDVSFASTPNGPIGIVHAEPHHVAESSATERLLREVSHLLGEMPIVLRCRLGVALLLRGPEALYRYAGSEADLLPVIRLTPRFPW